MNTLKIVLPFTVCLLVSSCGYTILKNNYPHADNPRLFTDLAIFNISGKADIIRWADGPEEPCYVFKVKIANLGTRPIDHAFKIAWADNPYDIENRRFPNAATVNEFNSRIAQYDTLTFSVSAVNQRYQAGREIRFIVVTQNRMPIDYCVTPFQFLYDHTEIRYDNNVLDYTIK